MSIDIFDDLFDVEPQESGPSTARLARDYDVVLARRAIAAYVVDALILSVPVLVGMWLLDRSFGSSSISRQPPATVADWLWLACLGGIPISYELVTAMAGGSPGYRLLGLRLQTVCGTRPGFVESAKRVGGLLIAFGIQVIALLNIPEEPVRRGGLDLNLPNDSVFSDASFSWWLTFLVVLVWQASNLYALIDAQRRTLPDLISGTVVVNAR